MGKIMVLLKANHVTGKNPIKPALNKRQKEIVDYIGNWGVCSYDKLAEYFRVSIMTIRRDVMELSRRNLVIKTLGGIQKVDLPTYLLESVLSARIPKNAEEKQAIAAKAMELITPKVKTIYIDGSTTCLELVKNIRENFDDLTVITNSALMCMELGKNPNITVLGIGGTYCPKSLSFAGPGCEEWVLNFFVDTVFVSTKAFIPDEGTFESALETLRIKQIIAKQCKNVTLLVDHSKFGQRALHKVLDISQISNIVTDAETPADQIALLKKCEKKVYIA
jgi:DeoR/GlpR family transcriptional regulator of sugar metabolism